MHNLVELIEVSPTISLEIRYATADNFLGKAVYGSPRCFLQKKVAKRLHSVQMALKKRGFGLKVYDGYRPLSVQKIFWKILPDPRYCADPAVGSKHNRGSAVDATLIDKAGRDLLMPSGYDEMTERAHRDYRGGPQEALDNRQILEEAMAKEGFLLFPTEWWHFDDPEWASYPIMDIPIEDL